MREKRSNDVFFVWSMRKEWRCNDGGIAITRSTLHCIVLIEAAVILFAFFQFYKRHSFHHFRWVLTGDEREKRRRKNVFNSNDRIFCFIPNDRCLYTREIIEWYQNRGISHILPFSQRPIFTWFYQRWMSAENEKNIENQQRETRKKQKRRKVIMRWSKKERIEEK